MADLEFVRNEKRSRYEARRDGVVVSVADYRERDGVLAFPHTYTNPDERGQGIAGDLVRFAFDDVRERGLKALALCPFVEVWAKRHPEYEDILSD